MVYSIVWNYWSLYTYLFEWWDAFSLAYIQLRVHSDSSKKNEVIINLSTKSVNRPKMDDSGVVSIPIPVNPLIPILIPIPVCLILSNLIPIPIPKWLKISVIPESLTSESPIFVIDPTCEFAWKLGQTLAAPSVWHATIF